MRTLRYVVPLLIIALPLHASENVEHYFRFVITQKSELDKLTHIISIDNVVGDTVYAYANSAEWEKFLDLGYVARELPHPATQYEHMMSDAPLGGILDWDRYPTYQAYVTMMNQYAATFPSICKLDTIGVTTRGHLILALKISDSVEVHEDEPQFLYTSTMHGDEVVGYVLLLRLADYLLNQYGQPTEEGVRATNLVNNMEIWINPLFNPDGTYRLTDTTISTAWRGNANGVDLNRNFPDRINDTNNTTSGRQIETRLMMQWTWKHNFSLSANFHGGAQVVNYPWDNGTPSGTYSMCPDDAWFINLSRAYATPNPDLMSGGFTNGITNGCQWYAVFGGRQDWMYWWNGGRETTIELYNTKSPAGSALPQRWTNNKESFLAYMEKALKGIRGIITDDVTHQPLRARVYVQGLPTVPVFSDSSVGDYHRLLLPGTYTLIVNAPGYWPDTVRNIVVVDSVATRIDVALHSMFTSVQRETEAPERFSLFQNYPNPFNPTTTIEFSIGRESHVSLKVFDVLGREVATLVDGRLGAGDHRCVFDAKNLSSGVYMYRLQTGALVQTKKLGLLR